MPPFPLISPTHGQDSPWGRRDLQDQQHLGLQRDPGEKRGWLLKHRGMLSLMEPHPAPWQDMGGAECWGPKTITYGWSRKTLQAGEATVALQPPLSSLSCLPLVTARPLGTLEGEKETWVSGSGCPEHPRLPRIAHRVPQ